MKEEKKRTIIKGKYILSETHDPSLHEGVPVIESVKGPFVPGKGYVGGNSPEIPIITPTEKRVIRADDFAVDSEGELVKGKEYGLGLEFAKSLEEAGFIEGHAVRDPWACILANHAEVERRKAAGEIPTQEPDRPSPKLYDFQCQSCGIVFEAVARDEKEKPCKGGCICAEGCQCECICDGECQCDCQCNEECVCEPCEGIAIRLIPTPASWSPSPERTAAQLKKRSLEHGRRNLKRGHSMRTNDSNKNTCDKWHSQTRSKVRRKGVIAERQHEWKAYAEKPPVEFRPLGNPMINVQGQAVYDKKRRKL